MQTATSCCADAFLVDKSKTIAVSGRARAAGFFFRASKRVIPFLQTLRCGGVRDRRSPIEEKTRTRLHYTGRVKLSATFLWQEHRRVGEHHAGSATRAHGGNG